MWIFTDNCIINHVMRKNDLWLTSIQGYPCSVKVVAFLRSYETIKWLWIHNKLAGDLFSTWAEIHNDQMSQESSCRWNNQVRKMHTNPKGQNSSQTVFLRISSSLEPSQAGQVSSHQGCTSPSLPEDVFFSCLSAISTPEKHFVYAFFSLFPWCWVMSINAVAAHSVQC